LKVKPPLLIQKAMYHEPSMPKAAQIYIMSSAGGILQGDKLKIDIIARKKTNAYITTQAATKIYKSENQYALQQIDVLLEKDSYLEFLPKQIIPHKSAQFKQEVNFTIDDDATLLYSETISAGRIAHGEKFDFESLIFRLNAYDSSKKILFSEAINIEPQNKKEEFEKLFGNNILYSSIYIISKASNSENLDSHIFQILKTKPIMSCSQLPNNSGIVVRILSNSNDEISDVISEIKQLVRKHLCKSQPNLAH
jgi:urease accessory protein